MDPSIHHAYLNKKHYRFRNEVRNAFLWNVIVILPISIASLLFGIFAPGECASETILTPLTFLIGFGIFYFIAMPLILSVQCLLWKGIITKVPQRFVYIQLFYAILGYCWFIVGAYIIFVANIKCIEEGSLHAIFALVIWTTSLVHSIYKLCCMCNSRNLEYKNRYFDYNQNVIANSNMIC